MKKKKFGLVTWSIVAIVTTLLACVGFVFGFVKEGIAIYSTESAKVVINGFNTYLVDFNGFFKPIIDGFTTHFIPTSYVFIVIVAFLAVVGIVLIAIAATAIARKNAKYLWHLIPLVIISTIGLYLMLSVGVSSGSTLAPCLSLLKKEGTLFIALFAKANIIQCIFAWVCAVSAVLAVISSIGYAVMVLIRAAQKHEKPAVEEVKAVADVKVKEAAPVVSEPTIATPVIAEEPEVEEPKEKKRVFLVVKRYNSCDHTVEAADEERKDNSTLTADDIRNIIREEQKAFETTREEKCACKEETKSSEKSTNASVCCTNETRTCAPNTVKKEEKAPVTPIIIAIPDPVTDEDEAPAKKPEPVARPSVTRDQIRDIVREELKRAIEEIIKVPQETVEETVEEVEEVPAVVETPVETVAVLNEKNVPVNVEEPKPAAEPKKASEPIERIAFADRMRNADPEMKENYNRIKSLLMSYGLKNRVSNGGDAFRLHKVTYAKIAVAGKSLKIYLALDPADYKNSTLPIKDASSKAIYKEIPLVFKIKSGLSMRRCEQLISEMMDKHGLEQVDRVEIKDYVALLDENTDDEE